MRETWKWEDAVVIGYASLQRWPLSVSDILIVQHFSAKQMCSLVRLYVPGLHLMSLQVSRER